MAWFGYNKNDNKEELLFVSKVRMAKPGIRLLDVVPRIWLSVDEEFSTDTKANSMKIFNWRCLKK